MICNLDYKFKSTLIFDGKTLMLDIILKVGTSINYLTTFIYFILYCQAQVQFISLTIVKSTIVPYMVLKCCLSVWHIML